MDQQIMITNKHRNNNNNNNILRRMNRDSHTILSKNKPQVRIIHIFAPEIIKTDPANFRELVQRLTGNNKPSSARKKLIGIKSSNKSVSTAEPEGISSSFERSVKSEEAAEIWRSSSSSGGSGDNESGGFLSGFADMEDGFMQQLGMFQPSNMDNVVLSNNHNSVLLHGLHNHYYTHNPQRHHQLQQQQQQQHHFFGEEDHTDHNQVI